MTLNPYTLMEDTEEDRKVRQRVTGEISEGKTVICKPVLEDPSIMEHQNRLICMLHKYAACDTCQHQTFTLFFRGDPNERMRLVACPRWDAEMSRITGKAPDIYIPTEVGNCQEGPLAFCSSCPSREDLLSMEIEKERPGWYGRWQRLKEHDDDGDG